MSKSGRRPKSAAIDIYFAEEYLAGVQGRSTAGKGTLASLTF
jgi:hypothetical protein